MSLNAVNAVNFKIQKLIETNQNNQLLMTKSDYSAINANHLKAALLANFRFSKYYPIVATEFGVYHADVIAINLEKNKFIEVETKINKYDLINDLKKNKHQHYNHIERWCEYVPHYFYYCVPKFLVEEALHLVKNRPYGVIEYFYKSNINPREWANKVKIKKRAKLLHKEKLDNTVIDQALKRMGSELTNYSIKEVTQTKITNN
jgi:hypothetical protein